MDSFSKQKIARLSYGWGAADINDKVDLYKRDKQARSLYMGLPDDKFFLLEKLNDDSLLVELVRSDYEILSRDSERAPAIARVLHLLNGKESIQAFLHIRNAATQQAVMECLSLSSRDRVDKALTQNAIERMEGVWKDPQDKNVFLATEGFLATLNESMRTCASDSCIGDTDVPFKDYTNFWMTRCLTRSYHSACA